MFLDEVGELSPHLQAKLLRVLQQREMRARGRQQDHQAGHSPAGRHQSRPGRGRQEGRFPPGSLLPAQRRDAARRPPLRERPRGYFAAGRALRQEVRAPNAAGKIAGLSPEARAYLQSYSWPGNVRELENAIERAVVLGSTDTLLAEDLPEQVRETHPERYRPASTKRLWKPRNARWCSRRSTRPITITEKAAKILGLHPNYLHKLIRTMDLKPALKRAKR